MICVDEDEYATGRGVKPTIVEVDMAGKRKMFTLIDYGRLIKLSLAAVLSLVPKHRTPFCNAFHEVPLDSFDHLNTYLVNGIFKLISMSFSLRH